MRVNQNESITLAVAGADVTISAAMLADLWINKVMRESAVAGNAIDGIAVSRPPLNEGETYLGAIIAGPIRKHVILLPGDNDDATWQEQMAWAKSIGGELPDRVEGALLFAILKDEFKPEAYWTREQLAANSNLAWYQSFYFGNQDYNITGYRLRARAVRSVTIE